jgi:hypothetical protein
MDGTDPKELLIRSVAWPPRRGRPHRALAAVRASLPAALWALVRCVLTTASLLAHRRVHLPSGSRGTVVHLPDGSASRIYRETVVDREPAVAAAASRE